MAILGKNTGGASNEGFAGGYTQVFGPYTATENGTVNDVAVLVSGGASSDNVIGVVYVDNGSNKPGAQLCAGAAVAIGASQAKGVVTSSVSGGPTITAGTKYWIGIACQSGNAVGYYDTSTNARWYQGSSDYPPPSPWGAGGTNDSVDHVVYIDYTSASGTAYSLTLGAGAMTVTGDAAVNPVGRVMSASLAAVTITGDAVNTPVGRTISATAGTMSVTGAAITSPVARTISATPAAVSVTGNAATLNIARTMTTAADSIVITGQSVTAPVGRVLIMSPGSIAISGFDFTSPGQGNWSYGGVKGWTYTEASGWTYDETPGWTYDKTPGWTYDETPGWTYRGVAG